MMSNSQFQNPLMERYPQFFDVQAGRGLVDGGFTTSSGWNGILTHLFQTLGALGLPAEFRIRQVKEKFGELRVYHNGQTGQHDGAVEAAIATAMEQSVVSCESCGNVGMRFEDHGWLCTLCASCRQRRSEQ